MKKLICFVIVGLLAAPMAWGNDGIECTLDGNEIAQFSSFAVPYGKPFYQNTHVYHQSKIRMEKLVTITSKVAGHFVEGASFKRVLFTVVDMPEDPTQDLYFQDSGWTNSQSIYVEAGVMLQKGDRGFVRSIPLRWSDDTNCQRYNELPEAEIVLESWESPVKLD